MGADERERAALDEGLAQMRAGWTPDQILAVLADAEKAIAELRTCAWCGEPITGEPIVDPEAVSWIGTGASAWCCQRCRDAHTNHRINTAGNEPS